jgi:manganese transport protein
MPEKIGSNDGRTLDQARGILDGTRKAGMFRRLLPFMGPAFIASIAYVDPGNFATNIQAGVQFGYMLLWVIVASNCMAMLIQALSAKIGIATGRNLAELCRENFPRPVTIGMWVIMEIVAMATDLAEFLGAALGFQLLLGIPLLAGGLLTAFATFLILAVERRGFRPMEGIITTFVGVIAICYLIETLIDRPDWALIGHHAFVPQLAGSQSLLLAAGILGATVMPHAIFLHSALTQGRVVVRDPAKLRRLFKFEIADVTIAMGLAGLVNAAILIMAASTFFNHAGHSVGTIEEAHLTLAPLLGSAASWIFALSLLASGLASSTVGTSAGQIIMQGFLKQHIPVWLRRIVTMAPSIIVIAIGFDPTRTLVLSQVVLSFGLPFAVVPLVLFTANPKIMGPMTNHRLTTVAAVICAVLIIALNFFLLYRMTLGG